MAGLGRQGLATLLALVVNGGSRLAMGLLVGRLGGPTALGTFQAGVSGAQLASIFGPASIGTAASSFLARSVQDDATRLALELHFRRRMRQTTFVVVAFGAAAWSLVLDESWTSTLAFALLIITLSYYALARGRLYGLGEITRAVRWNVGCSLLGLVLVAAAVLSELPGHWLLLPVAASYALFALANRSNAPAGELEPGLRREVDRFVALVVLGTLASTGFLESTMVMAKAVGSPAETGQFGAAFVLATPAAFVGSAVSLVLFPRLSHQTQSDVSTRSEMVNTTSRALSVIVIPMFATLILLHREVVAALWGPLYAPAAELLAIMLAATMLTTLAIPSVNSLTTRSRRGVLLSALCSSLGLLAGVAVWAALVPYVGLLGIAIGFLVGTAISSILPFSLTWAGEHHQWRGHSAVLALAVTTLIALAMIQNVHETSPASDLGMLLTFLAAYFTLARADVSRTITLLRDR